MKTKDFIVRALEIIAIACCIVFIVGSVAIGMNDEWRTFEAIACMFGLLFTSILIFTISIIIDKG